MDFASGHEMLKHRSLPSRAAGDVCAGGREGQDLTIDFEQLWDCRAAVAQRSTTAGGAGTHCTMLSTPSTLISCVRHHFDTSLSANSVCP